MKRKRELKDHKKDKKRKIDYLHTVNRKKLDFDHKKICSVTLRTTNIYICLTCGKYLQGKKLGTPAYSHALSNSHFIFMNVHTKKIFELPSHIEIKNESLKDIKYNISPHYNVTSIVQLIHMKNILYDTFNNPFYCGFLGINNMKKHSGMNVIFQLLSKIEELRNKLLLHIPQHSTPFVNAFSAMMKVMWNHKNFRNSYNPNVLIQEISNLSQSKFQIDIETDPKEFLIWIFNEMNKELVKKSNVNEIFRGKIIIQTTKIEYFDKDDEDVLKKENISIEKKKKKYFYLTCEVPNEELFNQSMDHEDRIKRTIVPLESVLNKFNGKKETLKSTFEGNVIKKIYRIKKIPQYLFIHFNRFSYNNYFKEKISTIIKFPIILDFTKYFNKNKNKNKNKIYYELFANLIHMGDLKEKLLTKDKMEKKVENENDSSYKIQLFDRIRKKWFEIYDLEIKEVMSEEITQSESYIVVYKRHYE